MRRRLSLIGLLWLGAALAQTTEPGGIPAEWLPVVTVLIGYGSALLVKPVTAIAKKLGNTRGVTTVAISAGLSVVLPLVFMLWQAAVTRQEQSIGAALASAVIAFLKANGDYILQVFANAKANQLAPPLPRRSGTSLPSSAPASVESGRMVGTPVSVPPGFQPLLGRAASGEACAPHDGDDYPSAVRLAEGGRS